VLPRSDARLEIGAAATTWR